MTTENQERKFLLVNFPGEECGSELRPVFEDEQTKTSIAEAVRTKSGELQERIKQISSSTQDVVNRRKPGSGRSRKSREIRDIRKQHQSQKDGLRHQLKILNGEVLGGISIQTSEEKKEVVEVVDLDNEQMRWWQRVKRDRHLLDMAKRNPDNFRYVQQGYKIRRQIKMGEADSKDFSALVEEVGYDNEEVIDYLAKITREMME